MGRKSTKDNKNIFQQLREEAGLTRAKAQELIEFMSDDRIEKIESDKLLPRPEEVLKMQEVYKHPELSNYYCSHECPIGKEYVPEVSEKELSQITLEMLATLNSLEKQKNRLIEITVDGFHKNMSMFWQVGFQIIGTNFFAAMAQPKKSMFLSLTRQVIFLIPLLIFLPPMMGYDGVWFATPIADTIATFTTLTLIIREYRLHKKQNLLH